MKPQRKDKCKPYMHRSVCALGSRLCRRKASIGLGAKSGQRRSEGKKAPGVRGNHGTTVCGESIKE